MAGKADILNLNFIIFHLLDPYFLFLLDMAPYRPPSNYKICILQQ